MIGILLGVLLILNPSGFGNGWISAQRLCLNIMNMNVIWIYEHILEMLDYDFSGHFLF